MDEDKKKRLEELKKQIDPEVLSKMANYLSGEGSTVNQSGAVLSSPGGSSHADLIRERRASRFQERVARRKMEDGKDTATGKSEKSPFQDITVLILSGTQIWARIVRSQCKALGFIKVLVFEDFTSLVRHLISSQKEGGKSLLLIAVAFHDFDFFLSSWEKLKMEMSEKRKLDLLDEIPFFVVLESGKQIEDSWKNKVPVGQILLLNEDIETNREKAKALLVGCQASGI